MASWSEKRKFLYAVAVIGIIVGGIGIPVFLLLYRAPTCSDGKMNGNEKGIDCGGKCSRLCQSAFLAPNVAWTRFERVVPGVYNLAAYLINPNTEGEARNVPYHMTLYDNNGMLIVDQSGMVTLPPHRNTLAFNSLVRVGESLPAKVLFEFTDKPDWYKKKDTLASIEVVSKEYVEEGEGSLLRVSLKNGSLSAVTNLGVYVILYDKEGNAIGFSKTIVDEIQPLSVATAPFTWNINRRGGVVSIEVLYVAE